MSDAPQGPGWWQASDLKWYPPTSTPGTGTAGGATAPSGQRASKRWILPVAVVAVVALVAGIGAFVLLNDDQADATVALEAANTTGPDPFTDSVTITEITEFPDTVQAVTNELTSQMSTDEATGTLTTTGTTPGLYGGTRDNTACDPAKLAAYLTDNPDKAKAWAAVQNIEPDQIADYINTLTPAYLTTDTLVTNHGFKNGKATPRQAVLQAGTAVLIDDAGTPRARCSCGNPLTRPATTTNVTKATTTGTPWPSFATDTVTTITTGPTLGTDDTPDTFTFTDITTGDTYQQPPASAGTTWVAVGQEVLPGVGVQDGRGIVWTSSDGATWNQTATTPGPLAAVARGDDKFVAVGSGPEQDMATGVVLSSEDGTTWSNPAATPFPFIDVAYGNGVWVAIGSGKYATSTDGATWTPGTAPLGDEYSNVDTIAFGDGKFVVAVSQGNRGYPYGAVTSTDGTTWSAVDESFMFDGSRLVSLAFTDRFGGVGFNWDELAPGAPNSSQTIHSAAAAMPVGGGPFTAVTVTPDYIDFTGLGTRGNEWVAAATVADRGDGNSSIWTSPDLATWTQVASITGYVEDVATSGGSGGTSTPAPTTTTAPAGGKVDRSNPVLQGLPQLEQILAADPAVPAQSQQAAAELTELTGATWTAEMVIALASSACGDWPTDPSDPEAHRVTEAGYQEWAAGVGPALGVTPEVARDAIDSRLWGPFQRLCG